MADKMAEMGWDAAAEKMEELFLTGEYAVKLLKDANPFRGGSNDEPQLPINCTNCDISYEECTKRILSNPRRACCHACEYTATHEQDEWEAWKRKNP